jgi:GDP-L-fucose synthase
MSLISPHDRIYVAGHRGMAGAAICRRLLSAGYRNLLLACHSELDLTDWSAVVDWFAVNQPDIVILAAAKVGGIQANSTYPADFLLQNLKIQNNVIENSWRCGVRRFLFLGSSCIYPKYADQPIQEEALLTGSLEPTNEWYAIAKITGIQLCRALKKQYGFDAISLMPTNLYGPGDNYHPENAHVLPALIRRVTEAERSSALQLTCWGTGSPLREFLHVDDLADAVVFTLERWQPEADDPVQHLNVGSGQELSIKTLAAIICDAVGYQGEILWDHSKPDGTPRKLLDSSRLHTLGWRANIPLEAGIRMAIADFLDATAKETVRIA